MAGNDDLEKELITIDDELESIEQQLSQLLDRQQSLNLRAKDIRQILEQSDVTAGFSGGGDAKVDVAQFEKDDFPWSARLDAARQTVFRLPAFRPLQLTVMNATMSGQDAMLIMPTGGGKSLCYQLPAVVSDGITVVVSPLVSLMQDQIMALHDLNVDARMMCADTDKDEVKMIYEAMTDPKATLKLLYVTPEKIAKAKRFMSKLEKMHGMGRLTRFAIDEVHCCSQWGHDFRPDYKILGILRRQFPGTPILGLTATATQRVLDDVRKILQLPKSLRCGLTFKASFNRANLFYEVLPKPQSGKEMLDELQRLIEKRFKGQTGIIYCFSRNETESVSRDLRSRGVRAAYYHAYLEPRARRQVHVDWISGKVQVIVATVAFGMGIDKPDVRFVIHHSLSKSMENYYQESGRAGRDDGPASCIVYFRLADLFRQSTMVFTEQTGQENLYRMLQYCLDQTRCRRSLIARHFGERWDAADCNKKCDHCASAGKTEVEESDITKACAEAIRVIKTKSTKEKRLTGLELGKLCRQEKGLLCKLGPQITDRIIGRMLSDGYLREEFHFTPYNTISYVVRGPRASVLENLQTARPIKMKVTKIRTNLTSPSTSTSKPNNGPNSSDKNRSNPLDKKSEKVKSRSSSSEAKNASKIVKKDKIVIDLDDSDFEDSLMDQEPSGGSLESRSTKRKESKTVLESEAKKIRLENADLDAVDGKKTKKERRKAVSHPLSSSEEENEPQVSVSSARRRRRRRLAKTLPTRNVDLAKSENDVAMVTSPLPSNELETTTSLGTGSSVGDVSTIVRGVFKRLRKERETLSASLETENSMKEQSLKVLDFAKNEPENRHTQSAPSTQNFEKDAELRKSKSTDDVFEEILDDEIWQPSDYVAMATNGILEKSGTKSTTDLEAESLDVNSNELQKVEKYSPPRRRFCWLDRQESEEPVNGDVIEPNDDVTRSSSESSDEEKSDKSDDMSSLYQIYTDQLSTLAVKDDSSDESEFSQRQSTLAPIAEDIETDSPIVSGNYRGIPRRNRTISGSSGGSVDQSILNLDKVPSHAEVDTLVSVSGEESEIEMTQLHDVYVNQLGQLK